MHTFKVFFTSKDKIKAKSTYEKVVGTSIGWEDDYSEYDHEDQLYRNTPLNKMSFSWNPKQIVYEDGTKTAR